jgi:hypothetical protein
MTPWALAASHGWDVVDSGCWEFRGPRNEDGYGRVGDGGIHKVHRLSYEQHVGPIPAGLKIRHTCDNPPCLNPEHLIPGTQSDNIADMRERGRASKGSTHYRSKLTERDIPAIREMLASGLTLTAVALKMSVAAGTIHAIATGRTWKHVAPTEGGN